MRQISILKAISLSFLIGSLTAFDLSLEDEKKGQFFDSKMTSIRGDGRDPNVRSDFEHIRLAIEAKENGVTDHPLLSSRADGVDVDMSLLYDYNHSINVKLGNATDMI